MNIQLWLMATTASIFSNIVITNSRNILCKMEFSTLILWLRNDGDREDKLCSPISLAVDSDILEKVFTSVEQKSIFQLVKSYVHKKFN